GGGGEEAGMVQSGGGQLMVARPRRKAHVVAAVAAFAVALVLVVAWDPGHAQEVQPPSSLRIMAPASPGGGWDQTARLAQVELRDGIVPGVVDVFNVPGAGGTIGPARLARTDRGPGGLVLVTGLVVRGANLTDQSAVT